MITTALKFCLIILTFILCQTWHLLTVFSFEIFVRFSWLLVCWIILLCVLDNWNIMIRFSFLLESFGKSWFAIIISIVLAALFVVIVGIHLVRFRLQLFLSFQDQEGSLKASSSFRAIFSTVQVCSLYALLMIKSGPWTTFIW